MGTASLCLAACSDACWERVTSRCAAKTGLSDLSKFSPLIVDGVTQAAESGLLGVLSPKAGPEVSSTIHNKSSWSSAAMVMQIASALLASVLWHSMAECWEEDSVEVLGGQGHEASCYLALPMRGPPGVVKTHGQAHWGYSYSIWAVVGWRAALVLAPWLNPPDTPCGSHIAGAFVPAIGRDAHRCSCLALLLSGPLGMALIWPSLDRGTCRTPSLSCMKAYAQLSPMSMSRMSFLTASSKEGRHALCGCAHTVASLNAISPLNGLYQVLSRDMPYHIGVSLCLPMPLHGSGLRAPTKSHLSPGIVIGKDRYHEIPPASRPTPPIGWGLWWNVHNCSLLVIFCKQRKSVIWKAIVGKYLRETLARAPRCLPPVN